MKKWPRKRKLALSLLILLISLVIIFSISDWPSPTLEIALRRMEKQYLVGPTEIIASMDFEYGSHDHLLLGKSEHGYTTFEYIDSLGWDNGYLCYFPKTENATLFCTEYAYRNADGESWLPIFLFPENQGTGSTKMTLMISTKENCETYQLAGQKMDSCYYLFSLPVDALKGEFFWLLQQALTGAYSEYILTGTVDISIEFFDVSGKLVDTYNRTVTK